MPPKKTPTTTTSPPASPTMTQPPAGDTSILSTTTNAEPKSPTTSKRGAKQQSDDVGIDDLTLPRSLTSRIARGALPANTSLQKDAITALTKSATVFISYLASTANELTSRKTIQSVDVMKALKEIELDGVMNLGAVGLDGRIGGRLERELEMWEESVKGKRKGYREKVKARESGVSDVVERGEDGEPIAKRARRGSDEDEESLLAKQLNGEGVNGHADDSMMGAEEETGLTGRDGDETEDDPDVQDEVEEDEPDDEDEDVDPLHESVDEDRIDVEESPQKKNRYVLAPDGRAEVGSGDESD